MGVKRRPEPFTIRSPGRVHAGDPIAGPPMNRVRSRGHGTRPKEVSVEDFQEQEYEFLRRLEEERVDRRKLLKRGLATAAGLTILVAARSGPRCAGEGARGPAAAGHEEEPRRARRGGKEGRAPQRHRAAARLGELRRDHLDLHEEVRHRDHERQPQRQLVARRIRRSSRSRAIPAHPTSSTSAPTFAVAGTVAGLYARYYVSTTRPSRGR